MTETTYLTLPTFTRKTKPKYQSNSPQQTVELYVVLSVTKKKIKIKLRNFRYCEILNGLRMKLVHRIYLWIGVFWINQDKKNGICLKLIAMIFYNLFYHLQSIKCCGSSTLIASTILLSHSFSSKENDSGRKYDGKKTPSWFEIKTVSSLVTHRLPS